MAKKSCIGARKQVFVSMLLTHKTVIVIFDHGMVVTLIFTG